MKVVKREYFELQLFSTKGTWIKLCKRATEEEVLAYYRKDNVLRWYKVRVVKVSEITEVYTELP
jgi:hypothetical protein